MADHAHQLKGLRTIVAGAVLLACVVVILGAYTRLVDAGLGCPDWPGCYGFIGVPTTDEHVAIAESRFPHAPVEAHKAWPEMVHRYFASTLGLVIIIIAVVSWRKREAGAPVWLPLGLVALVMLQGAFGAWTVTLKLWPQVVTLHLLGGFATLSLLWLLWLRLSAQGHALVGVRRPARVMLVVLVLQIALGGWTSSNYAALACHDFPTCHGEWLPPMDFAEGFNITQTIGPNYLGGQMESDARVTIQVMHRLGALIVLVLGLFLIARLWRQAAVLRNWLVAALTIQLSLGIANVLLALPLSVATAHNAGAALLLLVLVTVNSRREA